MLILKRKKNQFFLKKNKVNYPRMTWPDFSNHVAVPRGS